MVRKTSHALGRASLAAAGLLAIAAAPALALWPVTFNFNNNTSVEATATVQNHQTIYLRSGQVEPIQRWIELKGGDLETTSYYIADFHNMRTGGRECSYEVTIKAQTSSVFNPVQFTCTIVSQQNFDGYQCGNRADVLGSGGCSLHFFVCDP